MTTPTLTLPTSVARAGLHDHKLQGWNVFADLDGEHHYSLLSIYLSGRKLDPQSCTILDKIAQICAVADPRIWPLKVTRLISAYGRYLPAIAAAQVFLPEVNLGPAVIAKTASQFLQIQHTVGASLDAAHIERILTEHLETRTPLLGWGVPARKFDERYRELKTWYQLHGYTDRYFWRLVLEMEPILLHLKQLQPNISALISAILLDLDFSPDQANIVMLSFLQNTFFTNALEGASQQPDFLRKLPAGTTHYRGSSPKLSPRKQSQSRTHPVLS